MLPCIPTSSVSTTTRPAAVPSALGHNHMHRWSSCSNRSPQRGQGCALQERSHPHSFMCPPDRVGVPRELGKHYFWVRLGGFPEDNGIWVEEERSRHPYMGLIHSTEDPKDKKVAKGPVHSLCLN